MREIILCFREEIFASRLSEFIRKNYSREFRVVALMDKEDLLILKDSVRKEVSILTDDRELYEQMKEREIFYLDFDGRGEGMNPYRSAEAMLESLLWESRGERIVGQERKVRQIIFYTPGGSSTQRIAALKKCEELGKQGTTLYIPVRDMEFRVDKEEHPYDLSELCYRLKKEGNINGGHILAAVEKKEDYHILRGFHSPLHMGELSKEISCLTEIVCKETGYEYLVLDLQILPPDYEELFLSAEEFFAVEDGDTLREESVLYEGIRALKEALELSDDAYNIWRWEEQSIETKIM